MTENAALGAPVLDAETEAAIESLANGLGYASRSPVLRTPAEHGLAYEEISYPSSDGVPLEGWFIPAEGSTRLIVGMHAFGFNRYGFPSHVEPWKSAFGPGNDTEIDFTLDYKVLHDHGYNVLAFDFRNCGLSGDANGNRMSNNHFETRDVIGTLDYIRSRPDLSSMALGIFARCMGAGVVFRAIHSRPQAFDDVACLVAPLLLSPRVFVEATLEGAGLGEHIDEVDRRFRLLTSRTLADGNVSDWAPSVTVPTLTYGVYDDAITRPYDLENAYAALGATEKDMFWIEDETVRWAGYRYFQRHPQRILDWFDTHMK
ncbi:alpha/beta hydrolase [Nocardiopsis sp. RSe5-2]|uniref:Alpha/beta hydrolase n=1 Tax=Nocardiopsis endophytica TaxID=3018445 RepID=A0ABT4U4Q0_9ACTN|nr:alpha/beta hydrolase [Nocardiopsis endophytica]MDA2811928.1 alpha/beta hydrolase [Nocardiopsis endophytica]